jgi:hypothetical protein
MRFMRFLDAIFLSDPEPSIVQSEIMKKKKKRGDRRA